MISGPCVLVPAHLAAGLALRARYGVGEVWSRDGQPTSPELRALIDELQDLGRRHASARALPVAATTTAETAEADREWNRPGITASRPDPEWLTSAAVASQLRLSDRRVRQLAATEELSARRSGRTWLFKAEDVAEYAMRKAVAE